jgi:DNA repair photolyase
VRSEDPPRSPRGRATATNPANRFTRLSVEPEEPPPGKVETLYLRDGSRSAITYNSSPDIPFDASLNPYRGCEHGCIYCLSGETPILLATGMTRRLEELRPGDEIYGTRRRGWYRRYVKTRVLAHWEVRRPALRVHLENGASLIAGADHRFLTDRGWKFVVDDPRPGARRPHLTTNNKLMGTERFAPSPDRADPEYRRGYLCGIVRGDGLLASYHYEREGRSHDDQHHFRLALADPEALDRATTLLAAWGISVHRFHFQPASDGRRPLQAIRTHARANVERIQELIRWPSAPSSAWLRGHAAGIYDAEGSWSSGVLRISNTDERIIALLQQALHRFGFRAALETQGSARKRPVHVVRLLGGLSEALRFWHTTGPSIPRKTALDEQALKSGANLRVAAIEPLDRKVPLFDITTATGDFIADGVVSHNCYARPSHEFLGFSAGLDFETRIMVKEDAPELLRRELASRRWKPQVLALSGVTDPYQPVERKLGITRRCLEVLAEFRNPVGVITKNALVARDADLLAELAAHGAASANLSITTLDPELARRLEPRTSHPEKRLAAVAELAARGIPTGVMIAPVIPGLTDHEIPALVAAAAKAGAQRVGMLPLRLPGAVAELFIAWLEEHFPDRKDKVLNRQRAIRGGRLNDPRFGSRMRGEGIFIEQMRALFETACRRHGLDRARTPLSTAAFRRPGGNQLTLFGG